MDAWKIDPHLVWRLVLKSAVLSLFLFPILTPKNSSAELKVVEEIDSYYAWTEEYRVLPKGTVEVSSETEYDWPGRNDRAVRGRFNYLGRVEFGLTDRVSLAHAEEWETVNRHSLDDNDNEFAKEKGTKYSGFNFEGRYRIGEKGKYWVDPLLFLSFARDPRNGRFPSELEGRIVLSKNIGKANLTCNQVLQSEIGKGLRATPGFVFGTNYLLFDALRAGMEVKGEYWNPSLHQNELSGGPTLGYEYENFWIVLGCLFRFNGHTDNLNTRLIMGYRF